MGKYRARVSDKRALDEKERFWLFKLELMEPNRIEFEAGQYVEVDVGEGKKAKFWICSEPEMDHAIEVLVDVEADTVGSRCFGKLSPGDEVRFEGPNGKGLAGEGKKLYVVVDGVGIGLARSVILDLLEDEEENREIKLLWGLDYAEDMFWEEDWLQLSKEYENFWQQIILSHPPMPEWHLSSGYVEQILENEVVGDEGWNYLVMGFKARVGRVVEVLIGKGILEEKIKTVVFGE